MRRNSLPTPLWITSTLMRTRIRSLCSCLTPLPMQSSQHPTQAGMVAALDAYIGEVMTALENKGMAENTLVFFTSDNGPHEEGGADPITIRASAPYRGSL